MRSKGIQISDKISHVINVNLLDILEEIHNGNEFHWSILFLDVVGNIGEHETPQFQDNIFKLERGLFLNWDELNFLAKNIKQLISISLLGSKGKNLIHRYDSDLEKYITCDFVIEFVDSAYWNIFSNDEKFIKRLASKFKDIEFLEPDFLENQYERHDQA